MPVLFDKELTQKSSQAQDSGRLREINSHQLLQTNEDAGQIATFDQVLSVGSWFLDQQYNSVLPSTQPLPQGLLSRHEATGGGAFLGKLVLGKESESHFPVTVELVNTEVGRDLRLHIVPIHFGALEVAQYGHHSDSLVALAAAAAIAPQFILGLEDGLTGDCSSQKTEKSRINADHGTPLAALFESFQLQSNVLDSATQITGNTSLTIAQAAHLHHLPDKKSTKISGGAGLSKVAAGVPLRTMLRSALPKHALYIATQLDPAGQAHIVTLQESLFASDPAYDFGLIAVALGITASVVGDSAKEQKMERVLSVTSGDTPLKEIVR